MLFGSIIPRQTLIRTSLRAPKRFGILETPGKTKRAGQTAGTFATD
jgi:hypothetical protein